jgi:hypothetical protein
VRQGEALDVGADRFGGGAEQGDGPLVAVLGRVGDVQRPGRQGGSPLVDVMRIRIAPGAERRRRLSEAWERP